MAEISAEEKTFLIIRTIAALIFMVAAAVGVFFFIWKDNWNASGWCLLTEIACVMLNFFGGAYAKSTLQQKYSASFFQKFKFVALVLSILGLVAFVVYIILGATGKEVFSVYGHYVAAPIALAASVWFLAVFFDFRKYENLLS